MRRFWRRGEAKLGQRAEAERPCSTDFPSTDYCSVDEFVYMTESGYTKDEILKGERIILQVCKTHRFTTLMNPADSRPAFPLDTRL